MTFNLDDAAASPSYGARGRWLPPAVKVGRPPTECRQARIRGGLLATHPRLSS